MHKYLRPIEYIFLKLAYLTIHWDAPAQMTPDDNHLHFRQTAGVRDPNTMAKLRAGQIQLAKGEIQEIRSNGVVVNGTLYEADTIVFATGYKSDYLIDKLKNDGLWTYRHMLIPGLRNLGLLGASLHYSPNLLTSIQAVWLADVLRGFVTVASVEEMIETTNKRKRENLQFYPSYTQHPHMLSSSSFTPYWIDELLKDMKLSTRREKTIFAHWFKEPNVSCYKSVVTHHI